MDDHRITIGNKIACVCGNFLTNGKMNYTSCASTCATSGDWSSRVSSGWTSNVINSMDCVASAATLFCNSNTADVRSITDGGSSWTTTALRSEIKSLASAVTS